MTTEFDLIRRYRGAFTEQECKKFIDFIENFDQHNILVHDKENLHQVNHKTANVSYSYDFPSYSQLADEIIPKFKPCIDEYLEAVRRYQFVVGFILGTSRMVQYHIVRESLFYNYT